MNPPSLRHFFRFRWARPSGATTGELQPTAQNQAAEREGHHHAGGMPRPDQPRASHLICVGLEATRGVFRILRIRAGYDGWVECSTDGCLVRI